MNTEITNALKATSEDAPAEFNVIVVEECTPVLYKADGTAYADWNNVITADTAE